jgi:hypothetical protein
MFLKNWPHRKVKLTKIPVNCETVANTTMRSFTLNRVPYSLEEAPAIVGFVGYVFQVEEDFMLETSPILLNKHGEPQDVIAVCFTRGEEK